MYLVSSAVLVESGATPPRTRIISRHDQEQRKEKQGAPFLATNMGRDIGHIHLRLSPFSK